MRTVLHYLICIFFLSVVVFSSVAAYNSARLQEQNNIVLANADKLVAGLEVFKKNFGRYPTEVEFESREIMKEYFSEYPLPEFLGSVCTHNYMYSNPRASMYQLDLCLPGDLPPRVAGQIFKYTK
ncbi:MAG TPA: hypothetical protein VEA59_01170 [Patescibacteria group bacterium]|nr:hypothetical protein [Patescibacteria group bacterium]